jgi:hypothetical protein
VRRFGTIRRFRFAPLLGILLAAPGRAQLGPADATFWYPGTPGLTTTVQAGSHFGQELAAGDFDADGFADLAVGQPYVTVGGDSTAGAVLVLYGGVSGPVLAGHQVWTQDGFGGDPAEPDDYFGWTLATGDFDADGFDDLAVGVPFEDLGSFEAAGIVQVLYGGPAGLSAVGAQRWSQDSAGVPDVAEPEDDFGVALAAGDFDADGYDDLAVGASGEDLEGSPTYISLGAVHVLRGSDAGLVVGEPLYFRPDSDVVEVPPASGIAFGAALAACRLDSGPSDPVELAVGMPGLVVAAQASAGGLVVLDSLETSPETRLVVTQDSPGMPGAPEVGDAFGTSAACGDFDGDGADEIAVGSPFEAIGADAFAGAIHVVETGAAPVHTSFYEDLLTASTSEPNEFFGLAFAASDFDADGVVDLAIAAPGEVVGGLLGAGAVYVLYGQPGSGLVDAGHQRLTQLVDAPEDGDRFGSALAAGRFAGRAGKDLAIGAPFEEVAALDEIGAVEVLLAFGLFRDGFESGDRSAWSLSVP